MKKLIYILIVAISVIACDDSDFADLNQDPAVVNSPDIKYLFTASLDKIDNNAYTTWFYDNAQYFFPWTQTTVVVDGNNEQLVYNNETGGRFGKLYNDVMTYQAELRHIQGSFKGVDSAKYEKIKVMGYPLQIMTALKCTDIYGSMIYSEAMKARYSNPTDVKAKFDTQEELFDIWISELNKTVETLLNPVKIGEEEVPQVSLGSQDFVYGGNTGKWAKFANSLKLRIAVRLLHKNKAKAFQIAEEAFSNPAGLITKTADEFYYYRGPKFYNFGSSIWLGMGSKGLIDFLRDNKDPRVRFVFDKNDFNSKVVQCFLDEGKPLPRYIAKYVNTIEVDGKQKFDSWAAPGEPWVRYQGAPTSPDSTLNADVKNQYFNAENFKIKQGSKEKTYDPLSRYAEKNIRTKYDYTYPDKPSVTKQYKTDAPYHCVLFSAAEVNMYLAEFKLLGANITGDAATFFTDGIKASVTSFDRLAEENDLLYYSSTYDSNEETISLKDNEINDLLASADYQLTGDAALDLEKVYIQQYINFLKLPTELFVTTRRTGVPKTGSTVFAKEAFEISGTPLTIPRRFQIGYPSASNVNSDNSIAAHEAQGFTLGVNDPVILNSERVWYDQGAPNWGAGSNY